jgi:translation initiation factor IF-2
LAKIRVSQLAKELGVESKAILAKCREEGVDVPTHMTMLSIGLAETVRQWFSEASGGGGTAVETAPPVKVAAKPKRAKVTRLPEAPPEAPEDETPDSASATPPRSGGIAPVTEEPPAVFELTEAPVAPAPTEPEAQAPAPFAALPALIAEPEHIAPAAPIEAPAPEPIAPAAVAPAPPVESAPHPTHARTHGQPPASRPTIKLSSRSDGQPATVERQRIIPAPQLTRLEPAKIQGPKVVREEQPDVVQAPRRRPTGPNAPVSSTGVTAARPRAGAGVKVSDEEEESEAKKKAAKSNASKTLSNRRRGPDGRRGEAMEKLKEFSEQDLEERRRRIAESSKHRAAFDSHIRKGGERGHHVQAKTGVQRGEPISITEPITVKDLSAALGIKGNEIVTKLFRQGLNININSSLDRDTAGTIALEYGVELTFVQDATLEEELLAEFESHERLNLQPRPPVVTILGHVDHGKTSLLDRIRKANVAAGEAGGITQHTAAWMVQLGGTDGKPTRRVTFIDTPGHQAFTSMRARGANMTDVVVLVVSAAEGVQPQTIESINHAKAAEVPIVVAMNKIDRPDSNETQVLGQLAAQGLNPVEWGGDIEVVRTSAVTGQGIEELIETLDYQSELLELKADPDVPAMGTTIESRIAPGLGAVATVLVQDGTLKVGDVILCGPGYGRIRMLINDVGVSIPSAGPSTPVVVSGLNALPDAGDKFYVVADIEQARTLAEERQTLARKASLAGKSQVTLDNLFESMKAGDVKTINLIIKGDVQGSVETLQKTIGESSSEEVKLRVIHAAAGGITESDVELANASNAVIIGFHVVPDEGARAMAEQRRVEIRLYKVIYEIFDDLRKAMSGMLEPEIREKLHGHAEVRAVFKVSRVGNIGGCFVTDGHIQRGSRVRLSRDGVVITDDLAIETLRRMKDDVREVKAGLECGIKLAGYDDIKIGDVLEAYIRETIQRIL